MFPVSESGDKIHVKQGGKEHFKPTFDNDSYIEFPKRAFPAFWQIRWERVYFARKLAKKCVNFRTGELAGPSPEFVEEMATKIMLDKLNKQKQEMSWQIWAILAISIFTLLQVMGVIA